MIEKFIHSPVPVPLVIHQSFGANRACISETTGKTITCDGLNPPKGYRSVYSKMKGHNGLDIGATSWQPCYNAQRGIVAEVSTEKDRGLGVGVITKDKYFCEETGKPEHFKVRYWHFWANNVEEGQEVDTGALLGFCGSTGYSSGVHLHLEVKPVKVSWSKGKIKSYSNILQSNGYFGAVDPTPYMSDIYVLDFISVWKKVTEISARLAEIVADKIRG